MLFIVFSSVVLSMYTIIFLKLISYVTVNRWCREHSQSKKSLRKRQKSTSSLSSSKCVCIAVKVLHIVALKQRLMRTAPCVMPVICSARLAAHAMCV